MNGYGKVYQADRGLRAEPVSGRILAIDTTAEYGSISLAGEEILLHAPEGFSGVIFQHIESLLATHRLAPRGPGWLCRGLGTGSFTGVRIGLACVKGLGRGDGQARIRCIESRRAGEVWTTTPSPRDRCPAW